MRETRLLLVVRTLRAGICLSATVIALLAASAPFKPAQAICTGCIPGDPEAAALDVEMTFEELRQWIANDFAINMVQPALRAMANQLSAVAMQQTFMIGAMIDAKHQLETQRLFQELQVQAHKDYQPSTSFCTFGTAARSLAHSEAIGRYNALALSKRQMARHLGQQGMAGASGGGDDQAARWKHFTETYCDPQDNSWRPATGGGGGGGGGGANSSGLERVCVSGGAQNDRVNIDIDYTRMIENRRTLDISYPAYVNGPDEADVIALGNNLYGSNVQFREVSPSNADDAKYTHRYMSLRSVAAKRSVAENSFNAIVGMKSLGTTTNAGGTMQTYKYLGAILRDLGIPEDEVKQYLGLDPNSPRNTGGSDQIPDPSYYAQLEILAKKIYQNPSFYSNLYDTPANVKRKSAALKAIELMLDRAIYESQLRQEMAMSVLLSTKLEKNYDSVNTRLNK